MSALEKKSRQQRMKALFQISIFKKFNSSEFSEELILSKPTLNIHEILANEL